MTVTHPAVTPNALAAAQRARTIAAIAGDRAATPHLALTRDGRDALRRIADLLDTAAHTLETAQPPVVDGMTVTNTLPVDTWVPLDQAATIAADHPAIGFPPRFTQYVTAPVFRNKVDLPHALCPASRQLAAQEADLVARLLAVHTHLHRTPLARNDVMTACLKAAFGLHWEHARLAEAVAADAARPCNQPHASAPAATPHPKSAPLDLTGLTAYTVGVIRLAEQKNLHPTDAGTYRNIRRISLNAGGKHGTFGTLQIGARSGRLLRAELIHGNDGTPRRAEGATNVRRLLTGERIHACPDDCTAPSTAACRP